VQSQGLGKIAKGGASRSVTDSRQEKVLV